GYLFPLFKNGNKNLRIYYAAYRLGGIFKEVGYYAYQLGTIQDGDYFLIRRRKSNIVFIKNIHHQFYYLYHVQGFVLLRWHIGKVGKCGGYITQCIDLLDKGS